MHLPETACLSLQAPQTVLDLGGYHWGDDIIFDRTSGGLDADSGFRGSTEILKAVVNEILVEKCHFQRREVLLFGFGQGGMAALRFAGRYIPA
jgi:predicted esterase